MHNRCVCYFVCCGVMQTNENTKMLSIDALIMFCMLMILFKLHCFWSYFVEMQLDILKKIIYDAKLFLQAIGSKFLGFSFSLYGCMPLLLLIYLFLSHLHRHHLHLSSFQFMWLSPLLCHLPISYSFRFLLVGIILVLFPICVKRDNGFLRM